MASIVFYFGIMKLAREGDVSQEDRASKFHNLKLETIHVSVSYIILNLDEGDHTYSNVTYINSSHTSFRY